MKFLRFLIIEDSDIYIDELKSILSQFYVSEIFVANNIKEALIILKTENIDLVFLDLMIGKDFGMSLLSTKTPPVIVVSSYSNYAINAFEFDQIKDYILKPVNKNRLLKAVNKVLEDVGPEYDLIDAIFLKVGRKIEKFKYEKFDFAVAYGMYCKVYSGNNFILVNENIKNLEAQLPKNKFMRVHKSFIINLQKITGFNQNNLFINENEIPIGLTYKAKLNGIFRLFSYN